MPFTRRARVLIADDHTLVAEALKQFLVADFDVIAIVGDGHSLLQSAQALAPDVIVADIGMPLLNGLDASQRIKRILPHLKLIFVSLNRDPDVITEAFRRGASGYLVKTSPASELVKAIHQILKGKVYLSPELAASIPELDALRDGTNPARQKLTERQLEVLQLLAEGRSMKEAAALLNLTTRTVAFHKYRFMECLKLNNDAEIVMYAIREHIVFGTPGQSKDMPGPKSCRSRALSHVSSSA